MASSNNTWGAACTCCCISNHRSSQRSQPVEGERRDNDPARARDGVMPSPVCAQGWVVVGPHLRWGGKANAHRGRPLGVHITGGSKTSARMAAKYVGVAEAPATPAATAASPQKGWTRPARPSRHGKYAAWRPRGDGGVDRLACGREAGPSRSVSRRTSVGLGAHAPHSCTWCTAARATWRRAQAQQRNLDSPASAAYQCCLPSSSATSQLT